MKTIRQLPCPVCNYSFTPHALSKRPLGQYKADIRLCHGRKGLPHIAYDELKPSEIQLLRQRLLQTIQVALQEGILSQTDLHSLAPTTEIPQIQIPLTPTIQIPFTFNSHR